MYVRNWCCLKVSSIITFKWSEGRVVNFSIHCWLAIELWADMKSLGQHQSWANFTDVNKNETFRLRFEFIKFNSISIFAMEEETTVAGYTQIPQQVAPINTNWGPRVIELIIFFANSVIPSIFLWHLIHH